MAQITARHVLTAVISLAAAIGTTSGCVDNESALFVRGVLLLESPECLAKADPASTMQGLGVLDVAFRDTYNAALLVGNQLTRRGSRDQVRTETSRIRLSGAVVSVSSPDGTELDSFTTVGTGFVDPASGEEPGYGVMFAPLVNAGRVGAGGGDTLVSVSVKVFGETLGGQEIESADLTFPILICNGCLVAYPASAANPTAPAYECTATTDATLDIPCFFGQDQPIDCRLCANNPICRDPASNPSTTP